MFTCTQYLQHNALDVTGYKTQIKLSTVCSQAELKQQSASMFCLFLQEAMVVPRESTSYTCFDYMSLSAAEASMCVFVVYFIYIYFLNEHKGPLLSNNQISQDAKTFLHMWQPPIE